MKAYIFIEGGVFLCADALGAGGTYTGEMIFNTSMTGYQEILTDPSYAGQFIVFTMPEIGIVGTNQDDMESSKIHACGMFARRLNTFASNFRSTASLAEFLKSQGKIAVYNIDTRALTKLMRSRGAQNIIVSTEISDKNELEARLKASKKIAEIDFVAEVSTKEGYTHEKGVWSCAKGAYESPEKPAKCVAVLDYGVKQNILNELVSAGIKVRVFAHDTKADALIDMFKKGDINGVFLSNGPGDPVSLGAQIAEIKKLIEAKIPMFGICLGHQLLSNAFGYPTYKLKFGQHGSNHPVQNLITGAVEITSQNHNYNVPESIAEVANITHRNLFDNTIEGVAYKNAPVFSVQHHPESSAGPHESEYLFAQFLKAL